jgi:hypothetical protein
MLRDKIRNRQPGIMTYGMTPPKINNTPDKIAEIANKQIERLKDLELDALILYDVQEEANREDRPFPYLSTVDPTIYSSEYLTQLNVPRILYRCVGKYTETELTDWIKQQPGEDRYSVFVGASSSKQAVSLRLPDAYRHSKILNDRLMFGGVVIPERHIKYNDEHLRVAGKVQDGCSFFVSQATYNLEAAKNFLSDYYYYCTGNGIDMVPILINICPCGSQKTLEFMKWLGISIPKWLENDLVNSHDILDKSVTLSRKIFEELFEFGLEKGIPIGCSVESVSTRKVEIDASIQLVKDIKAIVDKRLAAASLA